MQVWHQSGPDWTRIEPNVLKYDLKKFRMCPIWAYLPHFGPKPDIPDFLHKTNTKSSLFAPGKDGGLLL